MNYLREHGSTKVTPQSEPMRADQVENSAGGYAWRSDTMDRLKRFLILGAEGGTFYVGERDFVRSQIDALRAATEHNALETVLEIVEVSDGGRAKSNDPALFALAYVSAHANAEGRAAAYEALPKVARTSTHLFHFLTYREGFAGWGRGMRRAVSRWYTERSPQSLAMQLIKYRQRDGWTHRDVLRLAHPEPTGGPGDALIEYAVKGELPDRLSAQPIATEFMDARSLIEAYELAQQAGSPDESAALIRSAGLPREAIKPEHLNAPIVWRALIGNMRPEAMLRNLGTMTRNGTLKPLGDVEQQIASDLANPDFIAGSRLHPLSVLNAQVTYASGGKVGLSRAEPYMPSGAIVGALDTAFRNAFGNVEAAGKRFLLGLDVSGSMGNPISGSNVLSCRDAAAAMALVTAKTEPWTHAVAFTAGGENFGVESRYYGRQRDGVLPFPMAHSSTLRDVTQQMDSLPFGGTDCALPMLYAKAHGLTVDCFVVYTDNETWAGSVHPAQALRQYREATGIDAKLVVVSMTASDFTIADPRDPGMLDVVGFDTATPSLISAFARGEL